MANHNYTIILFRVALLFVLAASLFVLSSSMPAWADTTSVINYSYDNANQLTSAVFANSTTTLTYSYDKSGNRIAYIENAPDHGGTSASVSSIVDTPANPCIGPNQNIITGHGYGANILKIEVSTDDGKTWTTTGVTDTSGRTLVCLKIVY